MIFKESNRLKLRPFIEADSSFIKELDSDPEVMKYLTDGRASDDKEVARAMGVFLEWKERENGKFGYWIAMEKETDAVIGWFHLRPLKLDPDNFQHLELGYRLQKKFWGKGYATEMSKVLVDYAFTELNVEAVWAHTMQANLGAQNVMLKCGLSLDREELYEPFPGNDKMSVWYKLENATE